MEKVKTVKRKMTTVIGVIFMLPAVLICMCILFEAGGAAVNITASHIQTAELADKIKNDTDAQVIDTYTFTGNSGGTGNHTDMVSYILIKTEDIGSVEYYTKDYNTYITVLEEWDGSSRMSDPFSEWTYPEDILNCYIVECVKSAPYRDSIMGH